MNRKTVQWLATFGRAGTLGTGLLCTVILAGTYWQPGWGDAAGAWILQRAQDRQWQHWHRIGELAGEGAEVERSELLDWSRELAGVRKLDSLAPVVRFVEPRIIALSEKLGDTAMAVVHARRLVSFDDRNIEALTTLGRLLAADHETRDEAEKLLRAACRRLPDNPSLVPTLCRILVARGEFADAAQLLVAAAATAPSNLWYVHWSEDPNHLAWFMPRSMGMGKIEARFTIDEPVEFLRFRLPSFRALELRDLQLCIEVAGETTSHSFTDLQPKLASMHWADGALIVSCTLDPSIELGAVQQAKGPGTYVVTAKATDRLAGWLADLLVGSVGSRLIEELWQLPIGREVARLRELVK